MPSSKCYKATEFCHKRPLEDESCSAKKLEVDDEPNNPGNVYSCHDMWRHLGTSHGTDQRQCKRPKWSGLAWCGDHGHTNRHRCYAERCYKRDGFLYFAEPADRFVSARGLLAGI